MSNSSSYICSSKKTNDQDDKFKICDIVEISKFENLFAKEYVPNWSEEFLLWEKKWRGLVASDLKGEELVGRFYKEEQQKRLIYLT